MEEGGEQVELNPFDQRVRTLIHFYHAKWHGRAPTANDLHRLLGTIPRADLDASLVKLHSAGLIHVVDGGWHPRAVPAASRAVLPIPRPSLRPTHV
jgi:hypothetical protein